MAKKAKYDWGKSSGKYQKFETRVQLKWTTAGSGDAPYSDSVYIDVGQCLSVSNRKLVRQGQVFKIKGMRAYTNDSAPVANLKVGVLPRTWPMFNSYKKARGLWNAHNLDALQDLGAGNLPAYYDFKVLMDPNHVTNHLGGGDVNLLPVDFEDSVAATGEWLYSQFADSGSTSDVHYCHMLGGHMDSNSSVEADDYVNSGDAFSVGAILAYSQSRGNAHTNLDAAGLDQQGLTSLRSGPWGALRGDDTQRTAVLDQLSTDNDDPPYDPAVYPGTRANLPAPVSVYYGGLAQLGGSSQTTASTSIPQFEAPLGLIRVEIDAESSTASMGGVHFMFDTEIMGTI